MSDDQDEMQDELQYTLVSDTGLLPVALKGNPLVLIADDESLMREVTELIIEEHGGRAILACDGEEAVARFQEFKEEIAFVFLDFSMPKLNGYEAYLKIKEIKPDIGVVFASGLRMIPEIEELVRKGDIQFISKPFHEVELIKAFAQLSEQVQ